MIIGSHVNFNSEQLLGSTKLALSYGANCFMFYTGAPQNTLRSPINDELTYKAYKLMKENNIDLENIICHAPYIINLANRSDESKYKFSKEFLRQELDRCNLLGIKYLVLHPGSAVKHPKDVAINNVIEALNEIILKEDTCTILLETMAGKGTEIGSKMDELETIINNIDYKDHIGVCLDTCHLNDSGIDLNNFENYLNLFDKHIGINRIKCIHINDSKNEILSHKDRHANIGFGTIGFNNLMKIVNHPKLKNVPKILETPYVGDNPPYKYEIEMIKNNKFNENLLEDIINN